MTVLCATPTGELTIDATSMHTAAWNAPDLLAFWANRSARSSGNEVMPGANGRRSFPVFRDERREIIDMVFGGRRDPAGNLHADPWAGLESNLDDFTAAVVDPPVAASRTATLILPSGVTVDGPIQVLEFQTGVHGEGVNLITGEVDVLMKATLEVVLPLGRLT